MALRSVCVCVCVCAKSEPNHPQKPDKEERVMIPSKKLDSGNEIRGIVSIDRVGANKGSSYSSNGLGSGQARLEHSETASQEKFRKKVMNFWRVKGSCLEYLKIWAAWSASRKVPQTFSSSAVAPTFVPSTDWGAIGQRYQDLQLSKKSGYRLTAREASQSPQCPLTSTSLILAIFRCRRTVGVGNAMSSMQETLPQSMQTK